MNDAVRVVHRAAICLAVLSGTVFGQSVTQTVELQAGWNSVFLEVDPAPQLADELFAAHAQVVGVWKRGGAEGIMAAPQAGGGPWQTWLPSSDPGRFAINLRVIDGGSVYLINTSAATTLNLIGRPTAKKTKYATGFNTVGFHVDPANAPTFQEYLAPAPELVRTNTRIFKLNDVTRDGSLVEVLDLNTDVTPRLGYWVKANGTADYDGPLSIGKDSLRGINFAKSGLSHTLALENLSTAPAGVEVSIRYLTSAVPVARKRASAVTALAPAPIKWLEYHSVAPMFTYNELPPDGAAAVWHLDEQGGDPETSSPRRMVEFTVKREGQAPAWIDRDGVGSQYEGVLEIKTATGFRRFVPVAAQVMGPPPGLRSVEPPGPPGLWVGMVTIRNVQWVTADAPIWTNDDPDDPSFEANRKCFGGWKDTEDCTLAYPPDPAAPDPCECPPCTDGTCSLVTLLCEGGPNHGEVCTEDANCACPCTPGADDGVCEYYCIGGDNAGLSCGAADCTTGGGECSDVEDDVENLRPTDSQFQFPILVHFDDTGASHMLSEVTLLWQPGAEGVPGKYVLATPACPGTCCDDLEASSILSGERFARRMSTAILAFDDPNEATDEIEDLDLVQGLDGGLITLDGTIVMAGDHRLNPFFHRHHPDHDGLDRLGSPDATELIEITRKLTLAFYDAQPSWLSGAGWKDQILAGDYFETVIGLYKTDFDSTQDDPDGIKVGGQFQLRRVADVGVLNNGWEGGCSQ